MRGVVDKAYAYAADHRLLSAGDTSYVYDADGFLLRGTRGAEVTEYAYASTGELRSVLLPDGRLVEYDNDAIGRRVAKRIDGAIVEKYLWLGRTRLLAVLHADGSLKYRFEYADDRTPVAMTHAGERFYLAYDQVGSLRAVTDASGAIVKAVTYDSFGTVLEDTNPPLDLPFGFAGGLHDADTGLVRFGFRDYAPEVGRWTAKDPIGFGGGDSDLYGYCGGDPVNYVDIDGLENLKAFFDIFNFGISLDIFRGGVDLSYTKYSSPCHIIECITISVSKGPGKGIALYSETGEYGRSLLNDSPTPSSGFVAGSSGYMASLHGGASGQFSLDSGGGGAMSGGIGTIIGLGGAVGGFLGYTICW